MIRILKHSFLLVGILFVASSFTNAYYVSHADIHGNNIATSISSPSDIKLNEVLPNPIGDDATGEWTELYNTGDWAIDVKGWVLKDAANNALIIDAAHTGGTTVVPAKGWLIVNRNSSSFSLNNGSEVVILNDTSTEIDSFSYGSTSEGRSWGRIPDGAGAWTNDLLPTPGGANA